jgi:uncharacterized membrane protein YfcA
MTFSDYVLIIGTGIAAGFINTVAGGGSLLTLPLLIFMGLPAAEANGSNRVAIFIQNIFAVKGFKSKGIAVFPFAYWVSISATLGALLGAYLATEISNSSFNKILSIVMVFVLAVTVLKPYLDKKEAFERFTKKRNLVSILLFFSIGIYGGFIQAGVGFIIMAALTGIHGLNLAKTNSVKVFVVLCYTSMALLVFIYNGKVLWTYGLILAVGNAIGGWIASRWSVGVNEKWIRLILILTLSVLALKLWMT